MSCRHCKNEELLPFLDLGMTPPSNAYLSVDDLENSETEYPLIIEFCPQCWLVQTRDFASRETFFSSDYAYFSSFSATWLAHAKNYVAQMTERFSLGGHSKIVEIAANDGYLLQYVKEAGIPCYGVEPTKSTASAARAKGIEIIEEFFGKELGEKLASQCQNADLMIANNVLAHVPDINDFVRGFTNLLKPDGVATFEFPHLLEMLANNQFDTVYHEHFSYLSLIAVQTIFAQNGLQIFDVETLPFHGGSLRIYAQRQDKGQHNISSNVDALLETERSAGLDTYEIYQNFQSKAEHVASDFFKSIQRCRKQGLKVAAYGAAAKGNTLLNFAKVDHTMISMVADSNPAKQGKFMPGSKIPIVSPEELIAFQPDHIVILPWNIKDEIKAQLSSAKQWGGKFVTAIPELTIE